MKMFNRRLTVCFPKSVPPLISWMWAWAPLHVLVVCAQRLGGTNKQAVRVLLAISYCAPATALTRLPEHGLGISQVMSIPDGICSFHNNWSQYSFDKVKIAPYPENIHIRVSVQHLLCAGTWPGVGYNEEENRRDPTSTNLQSGAGLGKMFL